MSTIIDDGDHHVPSVLSRASASAAAAICLASSSPSDNFVFIGCLPVEFATERLTSCSRGTIKLTGALRCSEERRRLERPVQARFEDWWLIGQLLAQIPVHDGGANLQHQMSAAF